jgi:hypothetical protein
LSLHRSLYRFGPQDNIHRHSGRATLLWNPEGLRQWMSERRPDKKILQMPGEERSRQFEVARIC